jgi:hypothetical protein
MSDASLIARYLIAVGDLDLLWESFMKSNQAVLNALLDLDLEDEFSTTQETEVRAWYIDAVTITDKYRTTPTASSLCNGELIDSESIKSMNSNASGNNSRSRLPEIPLPSYSGDQLGWPVFRDRFNTLVVQRSDLSNIERFH